jgi:NAD(P)-dependent dehydrogenase (short-subunit alcohol dehydrogenase family)
VRDRTALVTGSAGGIGAAVVAALTAAGWSAAGTDVVIDDVDVRRPGDVDALCDRIGDVDLLVNAAGIYGERVPFAGSDPDAWWDVLETNVRGPALLCRRLVPAMIARSGGVIVNVVSRAAVWDDPAHSSVAYATSKAALVRFTAALAAEVAGSGVLVVGLSPGFVRTGMTSGRPDIDGIPDSAFLPASAAADMVVALASGGYDALHGRFVHAGDDLAALVERVGQDPGVRLLTLGSGGPGDPMRP